MKKRYAIPSVRLLAEMARLSRATLTLTGIVVVLVFGASDAYADWISPASISINAPAGFTQEAIWLIQNATGNGGADYVAPNPGSGGGGTSWHTGTSGSSGVRFSFGFASAQSLDLLYMWDYSDRRTPSDWTLLLYSGAGATGATLLNSNFSLSGLSNTAASVKHIIDFGDVSGVLSGVLVTRNNSLGGGVGLAEFGFTTVPEPSSLTLLGLGLVVGLGCRLRKKSEA